MEISIIYLVNQAAVSEKKIELTEGGETMIFAGTMLCIAQRFITHPRKYN